MSALAAAALLAGCAAPPQSRDAHVLKFNDGGKFRILQLTDTHICWRDTLEYAGAYEQECWLLDTEKPDLVVYTGDVVTGTPAEPAWADFLKPCDERGIPFVVVLGNHDREQDMTEQQIAGAVMTHPMSLNTASQGWLDDLAIEIRSSDGGRAAAMLYCMDSGDYTQSPQVDCKYGWIRSDQAEWYREKSGAAAAANSNVPLPSYAFFHIPLTEYPEAFDAGDIVSGVRGEEGGHSSLNSGLLAAFVEQSDVHAAFVGHDHVNDYVVTRDGVSLVYGRFSGRNTTYHSLPYGARLVELSEDDYGFRTWIREYRGDCVQCDTVSVDADYSLKKAVPALKRVHGLERRTLVGEFSSLEDCLSGECSCVDTVASPYMPKTDTCGCHARVLTGKLCVPETGVWYFHVTGYDSATLSIDDWTVSGRKRFQGAVGLEEGCHDFKVVLLNSRESERMRVQWRPLRSPRYQDIPEERFFVE